MVGRDKDIGRLDNVFIIIGLSDRHSLGVLQYPHADSMFFDNSEMTGPVRTGFNSGNDGIGNKRRRRSRYADQDNAAFGRKMGLKSQFAEVLIERDQNPSFGYRAGENILIFAPWHFGPDPDHVVSFLA